MVSRDVLWQVLEASEIHKRILDVIKSLYAHSVAAACNLLYILSELHTVLFLPVCLSKLAVVVLHLHADLLECMSALVVCLGKCVNTNSNYLRFGAS